MKKYEKYYPIFIISLILFTFFFYIKPTTTGYFSGNFSFTVASSSTESGGSSSSGGSVSSSSGSSGSSSSSSENPAQTISNFDINQDFISATLVEGESKSFQLAVTNLGGNKIDISVEVKNLIFREHWLFFGCS